MSTSPSLPGQTGLRIRTLGGVAVERSGVGLIALSAQRKRLALLALLVGHDDGLSREKIFALLWSESEAEDARNALNQLLFGLRRELGADAIVGTTDIRLNRDRIASDYADFRSWLREDKLEAAVDAYRGRFLDGFHLKDAPEFERWADTVARRLHADYCWALEQLATRAAERADTARSAGWWRRLADVDPLSARITRRLIEALVANGEREAAIARGALYAALVRGELDAEPDASITAYIEELRQQPAIEEPQLQRSPRALLDATEQQPVQEADHPTRPERDTRAQRRSRPRGIVAGVALAAALVAVFALPLYRSRLERRDTGAARAPSIGRSDDSVGDRASKQPTLVNTNSGSQASASDRRRAAPAGKRRVLITALENRTGDSALNAFGALAADWITQGVQRTGIVTVVDPLGAFAQLRHQQLDAMSREAEARDLATARLAAADLIVSGAVYRHRDSLSLRARITDVASGSVVALLEPVNVDARTAIRGAEQLRSRVAGAVASLTDPRISSITTATSALPSYEAYSEYVAGLELFTRSRGLEALPHFAAASRVDTSFVQPLIWTAFIEGGQRDSAGRDSVIRIIARRRQTLSRLDQRALDYLLATQRQDIAAMTESARAAAALAPGSQWSFIAGDLALEDNRLREALHWFEQIDPEHGWAQQWFAYWHAHLTAYHLIGAHQKELSLARRAGEIGSMGIVVRSDEIRALIGLGRLGEARAVLDDVLREIGRMSPSPTTSPGEWMLDAAEEFRAHGHESEAIAMLARAERWSPSLDAEAWIRASVDTSAARANARRVLGTALYDAGNLDAAKALFANEALKNPTDYRVQSFMGLIAARLGDREAAERALLLLEKGPGLPSGRALRRGRILAVLGERDRAMREFEIAVPTSAETVFIVIHTKRDWWSLRDLIKFAFNPDRVFPGISVSGQ